MKSALKAHLEAASGLAGYVRTLLEVAADRLPPAVVEKLKEKVERFESTQ